MRDMDKNASENKEKTARGCNGPNMGLLDELFIFICDGLSRDVVSFLAKRA